MAKRQSIKGLGREVFFEKTQKDDKAVKHSTDISSKRLTDISVKQQTSFFERATFYVRPEQQEELEKLKIRLRSKLKKQNKQGKRQIDKSELIRLALDLLSEQDDDLLIKRLTDKS